MFIPSLSILRSLVTRLLPRLVGCFIASAAALGSFGVAKAQGAAPAGQEAAASSEPTFDILEFLVEGNTTLSTMQVERAVYPFLGPDKRIDDVQAAAQALQKVYRDQGYGFASVDVPPQRADTGVIRLQVEEGRIARTRVTGARYFSQGYILEQVAGAAENTVPHLPTLQLQLAEVNRSADRRVEPLLRPGREPGTTEVDLVVQDSLPLHGSLALNNQASPNTSNTRLQASLSYDNLFQRDHSVALTAVVTPEKSEEVRVFSASYTIPLGTAGLEPLAFSYTRSKSTVPAGVAGDTLFGNGSIFGVRRSFVMSLTPTELQMLTLSADHKAFKDTVDLPDESDPAITYMPLSAAWLGSFQSGPNSWQLGGTLSVGLRGLFNKQDQFAFKRFGASAGYSLLRLEARHTRVLPWGDLRLSAQVEGQIASGPLISNEQFVIGGVSSVRGYREAEAAGDHGLRSSLQITTPDLSKHFGARWLASWSARAFIDGALVQVRQPLPEQLSRFRMLGIGLGLQATGQMPFPLSLSLDLASPLLSTNLVGTEGLRVHASASVGF